MRHWTIRSLKINRHQSTPKYFSFGEHSILACQKLKFVSKTNITSLYVYSVSVTWMQIYFTLKRLMPRHGSYISCVPVVVLVVGSGTIKFHIFLWLETKKNIVGSGTCWHFKLRDVMLILHFANIFCLNLLYGLFYFFYRWFNFQSCCAMWMIV